MTTKVVRPIVLRSIQQQARLWLVRMDGDEVLSARETRALRKWLRSSRRHSQELRRLARFWREANILTGLLDHSSTWAPPQPADASSHDRSGFPQ